MTAAALRLFMGGRSNTPISDGIHGFNTATPMTFNGCFPFIDLVKSSEGIWEGSNIGGATADTNGDGWITGLPNGATATLTLAFNLSDIGGFLQPGDYRITTTSGATLNTFTPTTGITVTTTTVNLCEFTLADLTGAWSGLTLKILVHNATGAAIDVRDLKCYLISEETDLLAGKVFRQAYVDALSGARTIRMHDLQQFDQADSAWERKFSVFNQNMDKRCYAGSNGYLNGIHEGQCPIAVCMELADRASARPWFNLHVGLGERIYTFDHSVAGFRLYGQYSGNGSATNIPHGLIEGEKIISYSFDSNNTVLHPFNQDVAMYVKNATLDGGKAFQVSSTQFGSVVPLSSAAGITTTTGNLTTNSSVITGIASLANVSVGSVVYCTHLSGNGGVGVVASVDSASQVTLEFLDSNDCTSGTGVAITFNGDFGNGPVNRYSTMSSMDIDSVTDMIQPEMQAMKDYMDAHPSAKPPMFEVQNEVWNFGFPTYRWCQHVAATLAGDPGITPSGLAYYLLLVWKTAETVFGAGNFTLIHGGQGGFFGNMTNSFEYVDPGIRNAGQKLKTQEINALAGDSDPNVPTVIYSTAYYLGGSGNPNDGSLMDGPVFTKAVSAIGSGTIPDSYWDDRFASEISWQAGQLSADLAAVAAKVPNIRTGIYEAGHQVNGNVINSGPELTAAQGYMAYLDGDPGGVMYTTYINSLFAAHGSSIYTVNHYNGAGSRTVRNGAFFAWPIIPGDLSSTPRVAAWKAF